MAYYQNSSFWTIAHVSSPSTLGECTCIPSRLEESLTHALSIMFDLPGTLSLKEMCLRLNANVHISLENRATIEIGKYEKWGRFDYAIQDIMQRHKIPHSTQSLSSNKEVKNTTMLSQCRIHIVNRSTVLGMEVENMILIVEPSFVTINPVTKDIYQSVILDNVSRVKGQLVIIAAGGKERNRLKCNMCRRDKRNEDVRSWNKWVKYNYETVNHFIIPHLLREGTIALSPLPSQNHFLDKEEAIRMLTMNGSSLLEKLKALNEEGEKVMKSRSTIGNNVDNYRNALKQFVKAIVILQRRLIGATFSRFDPLYNFGEQEEDVNKYLVRVKLEETKLFINCAICLLELNLAEKAFEVLKFVNTDFENTKNNFLFLDHDAGETVKKMLQEAKDKFENSPKLKKLGALFVLKVKSSLSSSLVKEQINVKKLDKNMQDYDMEDIFLPGSLSPLAKLPESVLIPESVKESFTLSNRKKEIVLQILRPCSEFSQEWDLGDENGFEACDMYNQ